MATKALLEPILDGGIQNTNFFNGRLLTAEDLQDEQAAGRQHRRQLGRAIGAGIVHGLEVSLASGAGSTTARSVVTVTKGLAINAAGEVVALAGDATVTLVTEASNVAAEAGLFAVCAPAESADLVLTNGGLYVLTISPASGFAGLAPMTELGGDEGIGTSCGSRWAREGARFRVVSLTVTQDTENSTSPRNELMALATDVGGELGKANRNESLLAQKISRLRNIAAYLCLGIEGESSYGEQPFPSDSGESPRATYGALDELRTQKKLTDADVPLALLYWTIRGIEFVDWWSVRRPLIAPSVSREWGPVVDVRSRVEREAMFLQFEQQVDDLLTSGRPQSELAAIKAVEYFRYLPPCGVIPVTSEGPGPALFPFTFFSDISNGLQTTLPESIVIQPSELLSVLREALVLPPTDLLAPALPQTYSVQVQGGDAQQWVMAFTSREPRGVLETDGVARVLEDTWQGYRALLEKALNALSVGSSAPMIFTTGDVTGIAAALQRLVFFICDLPLMSGILRDVMDTARAYATLSLAGRLGFAASIEAFHNLRVIQAEAQARISLLAPRVQGTADGIGQSASTFGQFASELASKLPALAQAVTNRDLRAAVAAQAAINDQFSNA